MKKLILMALAMMCAVASWAAKRAEFAYALSATQEGDIATFTFKVTGDVTDSRIILTSTSSFGSVEIPVGAVTATAGASVDYDMSTLAGDYTWSVEVTSYPIEYTGVAYQQEATKRTTGYNGGVVIITDPEQDSFGYYVVGHSPKSASGKGFDYFDPQGNITASKQHGDEFSTSTINSPAHGDQLRGKAVFSDWSDAHSGYYIIDPLSPAAAPVQMLQGVRQTTDDTGDTYTAGAFKYGSTIIGGGAACVAFQGSGENTVMYSFVEDMTGTGFGRDKLMKYTIGTSDEITAAPTCLNPSTTLLRGGGDIIVYGDGFFATNNNTSAQGNTSTRPAFVYCDNTGAVKFNSSTLTEITSCGTGFAITADGSFAAFHNRGNDKIFLYSVTWSGNVPSFTKTGEISTPAGDAWSHLKFDPAGNLYAYLDKQGFTIYGFANDAPKATTPAKVADTVTGTSDTRNTRAMAYDLNMTKADDYIFFEYYLSADAKNVTFVFTDAEHNTKTYDCGARSAGSHSIYIDVSWFEGKDYLWSVEVTAYPSGSYRQFASIQFDKNYAGVIPVTDPNSPFFGYTLVALGANGGYKLYKPEPNNTPGPNNDPSFIISSTGNPDCFGTNPNYAGSPWRGTFFNGKFYVANDDAATSGIYFTDPSTLNVATQFFSGTRDQATGNFTFGGTTVSGRTSCVAFQGSGEETKLYTFDRINNKVVRYDIGEETSIKVAPTIFETASAKLINTDVDIITTENGFFASQRRSSGNQITGAPAFIYCNNEGTILYNAGEHSDIIPSCTSIALNAQADRLAVCRFSDTKIDVFSVEWSAEGVPSLTKLSEISTGLGTGKDWSHMRFDAAGNLHVYHKAKGYYVYSIAYPAAVTTTNYRLMVIHNNGVSGADDLEVAPESDEPARIFNLQGIEMHGELAPGVYIRRTSTKAEKFIVR